MGSGIYIRKEYTSQRLENMRLGMLGKNSKPWVSKKCEFCSSEFTVTPSRKDRAKFCNRICRGKFYSGSKSPHFKANREDLAKHQERNDMAYKDWRKNVWIRDNYKCKILNNDCHGRIEAHHILSWKDYPELRYQINNGITLCHAHHPKKREDEAKLSPYFKKLVAEMN